MRRNRLFWQLFALLLVVNVAVVAGLGFYGSRMLREFYHRQVTEDLEARARLCIPPVAALLDQPGSAQRIAALCGELKRHVPEMRITVILPSGEVIGDTDEDPKNMNNHGDRPEVQEALAGSVGSSVRYSATTREDRRYLAVPLLKGNDVRAVVRASLVVTGVESTLAVFRGHVLLLGLAGCATIAVISLIISGWISRPLERLRNGAVQFAHGDLSHRLPLTGVEEIRTVAAAMNHMAEELHQRIETILRQQNEREAMFSSMEEGILAVDNGGRIVSFNHSGATLLGASPARLQGRLIHEVLRKPDLLQVVEAALSDAIPVGCDLEVAGPEQRWLSVHGTALYDAGRQRIGALIVLHDVTRLHHLENVRRDFVANVSHELRTPITSIKGFVETLLDGALENRENAVRFLRIVLRQINRVNAIIGDLLTLSRIERGAEEQVIEFASQCVHDVLRAAAEMCQQKAADKQIAIELACPDDLRADVNASLVEQAVINLLDNAIKYSEPGGTVELSGAGAGAEVLITVQDHGCGIEAQHLPRLFERFYRVDKARSRDLGGTGLGLAIVKHIALAHRGSVRVESVVGRGSVFVLRLPVAEAGRGRGTRDMG
jgi:two-component system phosphate regulon sensor histidine kinase PhoR